MCQRVCRLVISKNNQGPLLTKAKESHPSEYCATSESDCGKTGQSERRQYSNSVLLDGR